MRLAFEAAGADYVDVARLPEPEGGVQAMFALMKSAEHEPFAPPFVRIAEQLIAQTANILNHVAPDLGLCPRDDASRVWANQLMLTIMDLAAEVHDTHHPIATSLYYEDQKPAARERSQYFVRDRIGKYLGWLERVLTRRGGEHFVGDRTSYVDLAAFQIMSGLDYAFPRALGRLSPDLPRLGALRDRVAALPRVAAYLSSERRLPFNEDGLFRSYPELDAPA